MSIELPGHLSYSQVSTYLKCGEQYRLERLLHAPQLPSWALCGGSAVHTATEEWDNTLLSGELREDFTDLWAKHFTMQIEDTEERREVKRADFRASGRASKDWPNKENEEWWNHKGPEFLANWAAWRTNSPWDLWVTAEGVPAVEIAFSVEIGGVLVKGAIDRVFVTADGTVVPVDLKTGREPDDTLQLGTYVKAMRDLMHVEAPVATYWMARSGGTTDLHPMERFTDAHLDYMYGKARAGMEAGIFLPHVTSMCRSCPVRDACFAVGGINAADYTPLRSE